eukprot:5755943-Amphidinium_carterae.2
MEGICWLPLKVHDHLDMRPQYQQAQSCKPIKPARSHVQEQDASCYACTRWGLGCKSWLAADSCAAAELQSCNTSRHKLGIVYFSQAQDDTAAAASGLPPYLPGKSHQVELLACLLSP